MRRTEPRFWLGALGVVLLGGALGGCTEEQRYEYLAHTDTVTQGAGDAAAVNKATHMINPWPAHSQNTNINMDGKRGHLAVRRYETNTSIKPKGVNGDYAVEVGSGNGNGNGNGLSR